MGITPESALESSRKYAQDVVVQLNASINEELAKRYTGGTFTYNCSQHCLRPYINDTVIAFMKENWKESGWELYYDSGYRSGYRSEPTFQLKPLKGNKKGFWHNLI